MALTKEFLLMDYKKAIARAKADFCEGACGRQSSEGHIGKVCVYRVVDKTQPPNHGDWGFFSYCETALKIDNSAKCFELKKVWPNK